MGRDLRRVPPGWRHPTDEDGDYFPVHDETYETAVSRWFDEYHAWERGERSGSEEDLDRWGIRPDPGAALPENVVRYKAALEVWHQGLETWIQAGRPGRPYWEREGDVPSPEDYEVRGSTTPTQFWEWDGNPPKSDSYRPAFDAEPTCYQVYENVTEGTPVSPVFGTKEEVVGWLVRQGYSERAASEFVESGYAPTFMSVTDESGVRAGFDIAAFDLTEDREDAS